MAADQAQRTEEPTPRRKQKAREEGQVASSRELTGAVQFAATVGLLALFADELRDALIAAARGVFRQGFRAELDFEHLWAALHALALGPLWFVGLFGALVLASGLLLHLLQTGFALSAKRFKLDFQRLNPVPKLREVPADNLSQTLKGLLLLPLVGLAFWYVLDSEFETLMLLPRQGVASGAATVGEVLIELLLQAAAVLLLLGFLDFYRQRRKTHKKLRMTKHEVKQEQKDLEGNPHVRARLRRLQRERSRRRMMSKVPEATVVVTNPTHYAVALEYKPETMAAPVVVAKGLDFLAQRIKKTAEDSGVPIVQNPPLAQALYRGAEVGSEIPANLYRAVAEILAYIFRLTRESSW